MWSKRRARKILDHAARRIASGGGCSDRTVMRIAVLADQSSDAAHNPVSFAGTLAKVGWSPNRIARSICLVRWGPLAPLIPATRALRARAPRVLRAWPVTSMLVVACVLAGAWKLATMTLVVAVLVRGSR